MSSNLFDSQNISFRGLLSVSDVFIPFRWLSMLSSHLSIGIPLGLFPIIFNFIATLSVDSSVTLWSIYRNRTGSVRRGRCCDKGLPIYAFIAKTPIQSRVRLENFLLSYNFFIIVLYCQLSLLEPCSGQWPNFEETINV